MTWWKENKYLLVREKNRIDNGYPDNNFRFEIENNTLWLKGVLLNYLSFECKYPNSYPFSPPIIYPKDRKKIYSPRHQLIDSSFCLDIREKTWNSSLSAEDLLKSLEILLRAGIKKTIMKKEKLDIVEETHPDPLRIKLESIKCIIPSDLTFPCNKNLGLYEFFYLAKEKKVKIVVTGVDNEGKIQKSDMANSIWFTESFLSNFKGIWIRAATEVINSILETKNLNEINQILLNSEIITNEKEIREYLENPIFLHLLFLDQKELNNYYYIKCNVEKDTCELGGIYLLKSKEIFERIPNKKKYSILDNKKVCIIGCGSGGSKIAEYLVKSGVSHLILIDDDILNTNNIIRHFNNLDDIGFKKVHAIKNKLKKINPNIKIDTIEKRVLIIDKGIDDIIKESDILVIATSSNVELFNQYAYLHKIPAIYSKVYPYGFGGEVIRVIPGVTPCLECINYRLSTLIEEEYKNITFPRTETISYDENLNGEISAIPSLAVDADFIVLITTKMIIELLTEADISIFKDLDNVILWGNEKEWIFNQGYQALKIDNKNFSQFKNCIVCYGNESIKKELKKTDEEILDRYKGIISEIERKDNNQDKN